MFTAPCRRVLLFILASLAAVTLPAQQIVRLPYAAAPTEAQGPVGDCGPLNFTQSASLTPITPSSIGCNQQGTGYHLDNRWWRAFHLGESGVEGDFTVCAIEMAVEFADDGDGSGQPLTVNLYQNSEECPFPGGTRTLVGTTTISVTDQSLTTLTIPVAGVLPALSELVVEIAVPDGVPTQDVFFPGSNAAGQTGPTYLSSSGCGLPEPVDAASIGFPDFHLIMKVFGTQGPLGPKDFEPDSKGNGVFELGETVEIHTAYKNLTAAPIDLHRPDDQHLRAHRDHRHDRGRGRELRNDPRGRDRQLRGCPRRLLHGAIRRRRLRTPRREPDRVPGDPDRRVAYWSGPRAPARHPHRGKLSRRADRRTSSTASSRRSSTTRSPAAAASPSPTAPASPPSASRWPCSC